MEHKAFLFDTQEFNHELNSMILDAGLKNNPEILLKFINNSIGRVYSPYTGELLDTSWKDELENGGVQELADFALTCYYSPEDDCGLSYFWDVLLEALQGIRTKFDPEYCVLGEPLRKQEFVLDPGGMGMGLVQAEDINNIHRELIGRRERIIANGLPKDEDLLYEDITFEELVEAYDELIRLYKAALENKKGLLMTF